MVRLCAIALGGLLLAGCKTLVPLPDTALLKPQPPPKCAVRPASGAGGSQAEKLVSLDFEAQCYRHAEMIARARLSKLQASLRQSAAKASKADTAAKPAKTTKGDSAAKPAKTTKGDSAAKPAKTTKGDTIAKQ